MTGFVLSLSEKAPLLSLTMMEPKFWYHPRPKGSLAEPEPQLPFVPCQRVFSLNWISSLRIPPRKVAPSWPLPKGRAYSIQVSLTLVCATGTLYQRAKSLMSVGRVPCFTVLYSSGSKLLAPTKKSWLLPSPEFHSPSSFPAPVPPHWFMLLPWPTRWISK